MDGSTRSHVVTFLALYTTLPKHPCFFCRLALWLSASHLSASSLPLRLSSPPLTTRKAQTKGPAVLEVASPRICNLLKPKMGQWQRRADLLAPVNHQLHAVDDVAQTVEIRAFLFLVCQRVRIVCGVRFRVATAKSWLRKQQKVGGSQYLQEC